MVSLLIIAHAPLATALRDCASHVYGGLPSHLGALDVHPNDDPVALHARAEAEVAQLDEGDGVLVLTDIAGATPGNIAQSLVSGSVRVVAGVNVPMLVRSVCYRSLPLAVLAEKAQQGGAKGIQEIDSSTPFNPCAMSSVSRPCSPVVNDTGVPDLATVKTGAVATVGAALDSRHALASIARTDERLCRTV